ncbi:MAG: MBL fold metallo-hydrolase [Clostridiales bacterium]|nr:MBL fold metallo-hydrolase [Clostridiales bacterium]
MNIKVLPFVTALTITTGTISGCAISSAESLHQPNGSTQNLSSENNLLQVHYIDVGQADSIFAELPNGQTMLIDAGNNEDGALVVDYIQSLGYNSIDFCIGTHPHEDHIGGMDDVIDTFEIGSVYLPYLPDESIPTTRTYEDVLTSISKKNLSIQSAKSGVSLLDTDQLKISMVAPVNSSYESLNDYSAVIHMTYGESSFLFTGDAETLSESEITDEIKADVLKVGHHGSDTSTSDEFLKKVDPKFAIISVGTGNKYGHPCQSTLEKLKNWGTTVYRTDELGSITVTTDGTQYAINSTKATVLPEPPSPNDPTSSNETVYITKTGKSYHRKTCSSLNDSKQPITLTDAKEKYQPCKKCNPPQ